MLNQMSLATPWCGLSNIVIVGEAIILAQSKQTVGYVSKATPTVSHKFSSTVAPVPRPFL